MALNWDDFTPIDAPIDRTRPRLANPDGSFSTERTITIEDGGRYYNIPTIIGGKERSEDEAVSEWRAGRNREVGSFRSLAEAEKSARERSDRIGQSLGDVKWDDFEPVNWDDFEPVDLPPVKVDALTQETPYLTEAERDEQLSTVVPRAPERPASEGVMWDGKTEQQRRNERLQEVGFAQASREARAAQDQPTIGPVTGAAPTAGNILSDLAKQPGYGLRGVRAGVREIAGDVTGSKSLKRKGAREAAGIALERETGNPAIDDEILRGLYQGAQSATRQAPGIMAGLFAGPAAALGYIGADVGAEAYTRYRERGASPVMAGLGAFGEGGTEILTEAMPMSFLVKKLGKVGAGEFITGLLAREIPTEQVATVVQDALDTAIANPDKTWAQYAAERPSAAFQTALAVIGQAGLMGAVNVGARAMAGQQPRGSLKPVIPSPDPQATIQRAEAAESALRQADLTAIMGAQSADEVFAAAQTALTRPAPLVDAVAAAMGQASDAELLARAGVPETGTNVPEMGTAPDLKSAANAPVLRTGLAGQVMSLPQQTMEARPMQQQVVGPAPVDIAATEAATSDENDRPEPTEAQKEAGNYKLGHTRLGGLDLSIENPAGTKRRPEWPTLKSHYGYIKGTLGKDGDHVDVFVKPGTPPDYAGNVYVVDQVKPDTGAFDEHKVLIGFSSAEEAENAYRENYTPDWRGLGALTEAPWDGFRQWVETGDHTKPVAWRPGDEDRNRLPGPALVADVPGQTPDAARSDQAAGVVEPDEGRQAAAAAGQEDVGPDRPVQPVREPAGADEALTGESIRAENAIRRAVEAVSDRTVGSWYPVTVEHRGRTQSFLSNIKRVVRDGKGPQAISLQQIRNGRLLAGQPLEPLVYGYRLTRANVLAEEGIPRRPTESEFRRWTNAFGEVQRPPVPRETPAVPKETDDRIYAKGGKPWKTRRGAELARQEFGKGKSGFQVVAVEGGFAIAPKEAAPAKRKPEPRLPESATPAETGEFRRLELLRRLKKAGGVNIADVGDILGENRKNAIRMAPSLFTKNGMGIDTLAQWMQERGYIGSEDVVDGMTAAERAWEILRDAVEKRAVYTLADLDDIGRRELAERMAKDSDLTADEAAEVIAEQPQDTTVEETVEEIVDGFDADAFLTEAGITDERQRDEIKEEAYYAANAEGLTYADAIRAAADQARSRAESAGVDRAGPREAEAEQAEEVGNTPSGAPRSLDAYINADEYEKSLRDTYFADGKRLSSRTTPQTAPIPPVGTWRIETRKGLDGREIQQLVEVSVDNLEITEGTGPEKWADVKRFAEWWRDGIEPPPINVIQHESGRLKVQDHRRLLAAKALDKKTIKAWVNWTVPAQRDGYNGPTGLTYELALAGATPPPVKNARPEQTIFTDDARALKRIKAELAEPEAILESPTPQSLAARENARIEAEKAEKKARVKAEREALEAQRKRETESQVAKTVDDFALGQTAEQQMVGRGLFDEQNAEPTQTTPVAESQAPVATPGEAQGEGRVTPTQALSVPQVLRAVVVDAPKFPAKVDPLVSPYVADQYRIEVVAGEQGPYAQVTALRSHRLPGSTVNTETFVPTHVLEHRQMQKVSDAAARLFAAEARQGALLPTERSPKADQTEPKRSGIGDQTLETRVDPVRQVDSPAFRAWFRDSKVVDASGNPLVVYHGAGRPDRIGKRFKRQRATSGPMPFFTDSAQVASGYATGKQDTSLTGDELDYTQWFTYRPKGSRSPQSVTRMWYDLSAEQRQSFNDAMENRVHLDDDGNVVSGDRGLAGPGTYSMYLRERRGNGIAAAIDLWLNSAAIFNEEHQFIQVLKAAGLDTRGIDFTEQNASMPAILPVYLRIERPLNTDLIPDSVVLELERAVKGKRRGPRGLGSDMWDKNNRDPREWLQQLTDDRRTGANSFVWTSIPDWVTDTLQRLGYDGIFDTGNKGGGGEGHTVYIPFNPNQVKSATGNKGTFKEGDNILETRAPIFYSELERQVEDINAKSMTPGDWTVRIRSLKGVKPDEIVWSGIEDWLKLQPAKVTKQAVLDYLNANGVKVEEVVLGAGPDVSDGLKNIAATITVSGNLPSTAKGWLELSGAIERRAQKAQASGADGAAQNLFALAEEANQRAERLETDSGREFQDTKFSNWQLPGGSNYRELLLTLPEKPSTFDPSKVEIKRNLRSQTQGETAIWYDGKKIIAYSDDPVLQSDGSYKQRPDSHWMDVARDLYEKGDRINKVPQQSPSFRSSHFDQPNILAHVRFNERTDAEGKRVLFIEEVQSDWAQKGKRQGFKTSERLREGKDYDYWARESARLFNEGANRVGSPLRDEWRQALAHRDALQGRPDEVPNAPFVQKTEAWVSLALKRMIRYASENGFDKISWTSGEQQAARYDLSKQISALAYYKRDDGAYDIEARKVGETDMLPIATKVAEAKLPDYVGKDLAQRIVRGDDRVGRSGWKTINGVDLKVGGHGMRAFYDSIIPNVANDVLKKLGGGKVGEISVKTALQDATGFDFLSAVGHTFDSWNTLSQEERTRLWNSEVAPQIARKITQPGFDITPAIRERALAGQALFTTDSRALPSLRNLTGEASPDQALFDALRVLGFDPGVSVEEESRTEDLGAPQRFDLGARAVLYNTAFQGHTRAADAQWMLEELLHAADAVGGARAISATMTRLAPGGDIRTEVEDAYLTGPSELVAQFLQYPLHPMYADRSETVRRAELFARLGVLYKVEPAALRQVAPLTAEAFDEAFGTSGDLQAVRDGVPAAGGAVREGAQRGPSVGMGGAALRGRSGGQDGRGAGRDREATLESRTADNGLAGFRARSARAFGGDVAGAAIDFRRGQFLETRADRRRPIAIPKETRTQAFERYIADNLNRLREIQKAVRESGGRAEEFGPRDVYRAAERFPGIVTDRVDRFTRHEVEPLLQALDKEGITPDELALYAYAMHAKERNAYIAQINEQFGDPDLAGERAGSGMTDEDADAVIAAAGEMADTYQALHARLMDIAKGTRDLLRDEGLITPAEHEAWSAQYENYVPLKGFEDEIDDKGRTLGTGAGFSIRGKESMPAMGRRSRAGQIIENLLLDRERAVIRAEKNRVGKALLDLVTANPDPRLWEVNPIEVKPRMGVVDGMRQVIYEQQPETGPQVFSTKVGGTEVRISLRDERLAEAMKNLTDAQVGPVLRFMQGFNSSLSRLYTGLNPTFVALNGFRDIVTGLIQAQRYNPKLTGKILKHYPGALAAGMRFEYGHVTHQERQMQREWDRWFAEYGRNGGRTGFMALKSLEDKVSEVQRLYRRFDPNAPVTTRAWARTMAVVEAIEGVNQAVENATRAAAYRGARELGMSQAEAASVAKNITVNFNRRGELTKWLAPFFLFFNAAVQGTNITVKALKSPRVQAAVGGMMAGAVALALANVSIGGDDDDEIAYWDKIPDYVKERNLIVMLPPGDYDMEGVETVGKKGRYLKIPLPYGFNTFVVAANAAVDGLRNMKDPSTGRAPMKAAGDLAVAALNSYNPAGGETPLTSVVPILQPAFQAFFNVNRFGDQLYPVPQFGRMEARAEQYFDSQRGSAAQRLAETMNRATGGNAVRDGYLSIQPAILENTFRYFTGGLGQFGSDLVTPILDLQRVGEVNKARLPFVRQLYGEVGLPESRRIYNELRTEAVRTTQEVKTLAERGELDTIDDKTELFLTLGEMDESVRKALSQLRQMELLVHDDDTLTKDERRRNLNEIELQRKELYSMFLSTWKQGVRQ